MNFSFLFKSKSDDRDARQQAKIAECQTFLVEAAIATADAAQAITHKLKQNLEDAISKFESTSRILNDALILCDMRGIIQHANVSAERDFGPNLEATSILNLFVHNHQEGAVDLFTRLNEDFTSETQMIGCNSITGEHFAVVPRAERLEWHDKTASMLILVRKLSEVLSSDNQGMAAVPAVLTSEVPDGIIMVRNELIVATNPMISQLFGYRSEEILQHPLQTLFPLSDHEKLFLTDEPYQAFISGRHENGTVLNLLLTSTKLVSNEHSRIITVRLVNDARREEQMNAFTEDNGIEMVVCFNKDFAITFANAAFATFFNQTRTGILGVKMQDVLPEANFDALAASIALLTVEQPTFRSQVYFPASEDKKSSLIDWITHAVFDVYGQPHEYQRTGRDISAIVSSIEDVKLQDFWLN